MYKISDKINLFENGIKQNMIVFCPLDSALWKFLKRATDITCSAIALLLSFPLFLLISLLIKLDSAGPIIYKQRRLGQKGRIFWIYKFRTMPDGTENGIGPVWGKEDDERSTSVGFYLRLLHLDELPQLINVLKGQMSLVGPRPERPYFVTQFERTIPDYQFRHRVKPGITGWAQINGYRGNSSVVKRVKYDHFYIENWTLVLDIKILLKTPFAANIKPFFRKNKTPLYSPCFPQDNLILKENSSCVPSKKE